MAKIVQIFLEESKRIDGLCGGLKEVTVDPQWPTLNRQSLVDICVVTVSRFL